MNLGMKIWVLQYFSLNKKLSELAETQVVSCMGEMIVVPAKFDGYSIKLKHFLLVDITIFCQLFKNCIQNLIK